MRRACITGGAGFIGSNLANHLRALGVEVSIVDNFRTGREEFVASLLDDPGVSIHRGDVLEPGVLEPAFEGCDWVFHLQANADVRHGLEHPDRDLQQNTVATARVLEAMRTARVSKIAFSSTGSVYGEPAVFPTPEDAPFPVQTSLYGASKLACEGLIAAYTNGYGFTGIVFRFVSILGERYTHGHVFDFFRALKRDPTRLTVLGDGHQEKSYLYVGDCVRAISGAVQRHEGDDGSFNVYNLGTDETVIVNDSVRVICERLGVSPKLEYAGGTRGWVGDSPLIHLDCAKIRGLSWRPSKSIAEAVGLTVDWLVENRYVWDDSRSAGGARL